MAVAFLGALRLLAADRPLCLGVDDVRWLDVASLAALRYALARVDHEPVAALLAVALRRSRLPGLSRPSPIRPSLSSESAVGRASMPLWPRRSLPG